MASNLLGELGAMTLRSETAERLLAEARANLRERDAEIWDFEQRKLESSRAAKSNDAALADLERDLTSARALHAEVDSVRAALDQRSGELAKSLEAKDAALQRAEQKIVMVEVRIAEHTKAIDAEREAFEERLVKLKEQLEASRPHAPSPKGRCKPRGRNAAPGATTRKAVAARRGKTRHPRPTKWRATSRPPARIRRIAPTPF